MKLLFAMIVFAIAMALSGCFSLTAGDSISGKGGRRVYLHDRVFCLALDAITFPIQVAIFTPYIITEVVENNTGEGLRIKQEEKARDKYVQLLEDDDSSMFTNPDFACATNKVAMQALNKWFEEWMYKHSDEDVHKYAAFLMKSPDLFRKVNSFWHSSRITTDDYRKAFDIAVGLYLEDGDESSKDIVSSAIHKSAFTDQELNDMLEGKIGKNKELREIICRIIEYRKQNREQELKMQEEKRRLEAEELKRREENFKEFQRQQMIRIKKEEQECAARKEHRDKMKCHVKALWSNDTEPFNSALAWYRDSYVEDVWDHALRSRKESIPIKNLRLLAEKVFESDFQPPVYIRYLFSRNEFESNDLRNYYRMLIERQKNGWDVLQAIAILVCNSKTPDDIVLDSYKEHLLQSDRYVNYKQHEQDRLFAEKTQQEVPK